jgi:hypothetical protein
MQIFLMEKRPFPHPRFIFNSLYCATDWLSYLVKNRKMKWLTKNSYIPPYGEDKMAGFIRCAAKVLAGK